jgi:small subunit ribosomal protein S11e
MVSIRGRILNGVVVSTKMKRTIIVRREYLHYVTKYNRYEKRHKNVAAHLSPAFIGVQVLFAIVKIFGMNLYKYTNLCL